MASPNTNLVEKVELPEADWNFFPKGKSMPPNWQMNHWLNYEYARSSEVVRRAVKKLRERKVPSRGTDTYPQDAKVPRFAVYLNQYYPEFPKTPWLELPAQQRECRIMECGGNQIAEPFEDDILKVINLSVFAHKVQMGEINITAGKLPDELFAILEIDFTQGDKLIQKKFRDWLAARREELQEIFAGTKLESAVTPSREKMRVGQGRNVRTYKSWLNRLSALRLMEFYQGDYRKCADVTSDPEDIPLYNRISKATWSAAKKEAEKLLNRFHIAWQQSYYPPFILRPGDYYETIHEPTLGHPLVKERKTKKTS